ncbi:DUF4124 domain-containing protein [Gilvimarinus sp. F26214L]|uniref:DUF4124 domain-containing protein n=1 Tax=Gilvimarinus sp. DZF01 TaxID=3461371 RepID=UPI00404558E6
MAKLLTVFLATALISLPTLAAKNYYKWTDEDGVTHYSARKPHDQSADVVSVATGRPAPASDSQAPSPDKARNDEPAGNNRAQSESGNLKDPERCEAARNNLEVLRNNAKVRMKDENGEIHYLSEEEKAEKSREFQQAVDESC